MEVNDVCSAYWCDRYVWRNDAISDRGRAFAGPGRTDARASAAKCGSLRGTSGTGDPDAAGRSDLLAGGVSVRHPVHDERLRAAGVHEHGRRHERHHVQTVRRIVRAAVARDRCDRRVWNAAAFPGHHDRVARRCGVLVVSRFAPVRVVARTQAPHDGRLYTGELTALVILNLLERMMDPTSNK